MGARGEALAQQFEQTNQAVIDTVQSASDAKWKASCQAEGWSAGVTAHHIAGSHEAIAGLVQAAANGQPLPPITPEMLNQGNAQHAQQFANCTKQETLELLRSKGAAAASMLRGLSDEQLDRKGTLFGGEMTAQQIAENVLIGHPQGHLQSIKAAI
jgi:uncharacterized damage-inducible protein DinB